MTIAPPLNILTWADINNAFSRVATIRVHDPADDQESQGLFQLLKNVLIVTKPVWGNILDDWSSHSEFTVMIDDGSRVLLEPKTSAKKPYTAKITVESNSEFNAQEVLGSAKIIKLKVHKDNPLYKLLDELQNAQKRER